MEIYLRDYDIFRAQGNQEIERFIVPGSNPSGPFGAKAAAEIPTGGVAPAMLNTIHQVAGVRLHQIPATPERVWRALDRNNSVRVADE